MLEELEKLASQIEKEVTTFYTSIILMEKDFCDEYLGNYMSRFRNGLEDMCKTIEEPAEEVKIMHTIIRGFVQTVDAIIADENYVCKTMNDFLHFVFIRFCRKNFVHYLMETL